MVTTNQQGLIKKAAKNEMAHKSPKTIKDYVKLYEGEIAKALPAVMTPQRFMRIVTTAITNNPKLAECSPQSFIGAMLNAAQLGLEPNTPLGQAYLIPYGKNCQFQIGYKGLLDLAYRTGEVRSITAEIVKENDVFEYELGLEPKLKHIPAKSNRGNVIFYYAVFKLKNGGEGFQVMSKEDIDAHARKYSKSFNNGPWQSAYDEMAKKTVLKKLLKYMPLKTDFVMAVAQDETSKEYSPGMSAEDIQEAPNEFVDADYEVKEETGEIVK